MKITAIVFQTSNSPKSCDLLPNVIWCRNSYLVTINNKHTGVAREVAGVAEATPIFQVLFNKFGKNISVKKLYLLQATPISKS